MSTKRADRSREKDLMVRGQQRKMRARGWRALAERSGPGLGVDMGFDDACLRATRQRQRPPSQSTPANPLRRATLQTTMADYAHFQALYTTVPSFAPLFPVGLLPYLAFALLTATFALAFYFSTLPKDTFPVRETAVASTASLLGGFGVVALFCTTGVYV
ncbi:hypothetical protein B0H21DRAFT_114089 [Amylocystis lapponica]|nr:hypothetical protein B0H21DRAFT_114089 [Amylocystis lapponica]